MHFVISYDLSAEGTRRAEIEARIEDILSPFQHAKRLTTFYIGNPPYERKALLG